MAGSQTLYLPTHYIEPSSPVFSHSQHGEQTKGAEGGEGGCQDGVSISRSGVAVLGLDVRRAHQVLIRCNIDMVYVGETWLTNLRWTLQLTHFVRISGFVQSYGAFAVMSRERNKDSKASSTLK